MEAVQNSTHTSTIVVVVVILATNEQTNEGVYAYKTL